MKLRLIVETGIPSVKRLSGAVSISILSAVVFLFTGFSRQASLRAQAEGLKESAIEEFRKADYPSAIEFMKRAAAENPGDPEVYYYLGYFTHYLCYDSVPLAGFDLERSDEVLEYLAKAVELDPGYGNAYYFIGAERGARARIHLFQGDVDAAREELIKGRDEGGYPDWLIEYGRNTLKSCSKNAILFLGGDADTNPVQYLQIVESFRLDVTALPQALLNRPWFAKMTAEGVEGGCRPAPISWTEYQIMNMHPYKWESNEMTVEISPEIRRIYGIEDEFFVWKMTPDISEGLMDAGSALAADIIVTNRWERPVYFSLACGKDFGLRNNFQLSALAWKLVPGGTEGSGLAVDEDAVERVLLDSKNFTDLNSVKDKGMPRVSRMLLNYPAALYRAGLYYLERGRKDEARRILDLFEEVGFEELIEMSDVTPHFESMKDELD